MPIRVRFAIINNLLMSCLLLLKTAADKLKREMEEFGYPPQFPVPTTENAEDEKAASATAKENENSQVDNKAKSKKVNCFWRLTFKEDNCLFVLV